MDIINFVREESKQENQWIYKIALKPILQLIILVEFHDLFSWAFRTIIGLAQATFNRWKHSDLQSWNEDGRIQWVITLRFVSLLVWRRCWFISNFLALERAGLRCNCRILRTKLFGQVVDHSWRLQGCNAICRPDWHCYYSVNFEKYWDRVLNTSWRNTSR